MIEEIEMRKQVGLIALGLSMVLLIGCGGSSSSDDVIDNNEEETTTLNTPVEVKQNIIGSWSVGCQKIDGGIRFEIDKAIFNADGTGKHEGAEYTAADCNDGDEIWSWGDTFTYEIKNATKSIDGKDAVEIDIMLTKDNEEYYTMLHFSAVDKFIMADTDDEEDGDTPETRENDFTGKESWVYIKQ
jgi:hypothetical protein